MGQNCSRKDRPFGVSGDSAPLCTYTQTRALPLRFPLPCSHPTTTPPRRRCFCHIRLSAWSCPFCLSTTDRPSAQTRRASVPMHGGCRHNRNYRSLSLRLNREPPVPSEFSCAPRLDSTTSTSGGREEQARILFHPPSFRFDLLTKILIQSYALVASVSPSRDVNNPRDSRFFERRKEEDLVRRGGDRYYGAGVDWMDASLLKFSLPSTTDTDDSEKMRGVELRKRLLTVHIARTSGTSSERRRKAALEGREASRVRVRMQAHHGARRDPAGTQNRPSYPNNIQSELREIEQYRKIDVAAGLSLDESKGEGSEEVGPVFAYMYIAVRNRPIRRTADLSGEQFWPFKVSNP
ncbi:hypothetical protein B0H13DRAFT_2291673 [Mycena leptocephala]|nr:hypothetical protein B0H13DRAFT_2291673 [Mycena leptocephala]